MNSQKVGVGVQVSLLFLLLLLSQQNWYQIHLMNELKQLYYQHEVVAIARFDRAVQAAERRAEARAVELWQADPTLLHASAKEAAIVPAVRIGAAFCCRRSERVHNKFAAIASGHKLRFELHTLVTALGGARPHNVPCSAP